MPLRDVWDAGDAGVPRRPAPAARRPRPPCWPSMGVGVVVDGHGATVRRRRRPPVEPGDALVVATSGSTGTPKGAVLTHDAVPPRRWRPATGSASSRTTTGWPCLPLAHVGGLAVVTRAIVVGTSLTVLPGFDPAAVAAVGASHVSPRADRAAPHRPGPLPHDRPRRLGAARDLPAHVVTTYGMTETGSGVVYDGRPLDGVDVRVDDDGQIHVRGPMLLRAYRDGTDPLVDGWLPTGDLGGWLTDGRLAVEGRARRPHHHRRRERVAGADRGVAARRPGCRRRRGVRSRPDDEWGAGGDRGRRARGATPPADAGLAARRGQGGAARVSACRVADWSSTPSRAPRSARSAAPSSPTSPAPDPPWPRPGVSEQLSRGVAR